MNRSNKIILSILFLLTNLFGFSACRGKENCDFLEVVPLHLEIVPDSLPVNHTHYFQAGYFSTSICEIPEFPKILYGDHAVTMELWIESNHCGGCIGMEPQRTTFLPFTPTDTGTWVVRLFIAGNNYETHFIKVMDMPLDCF